MNACETTAHPPSKRLAPNHYPTENVEEAQFSCYSDPPTPTVEGFSSSVCESQGNVQQSRRARLGCGDSAWVLTYVGLGGSGARIALPNGGLTNSPVPASVAGGEGEIGAGRLVCAR